jgi:hypothetical protein
VSGQVGRKLREKVIDTRGSKHSQQSILFTVTEGTRKMRLGDLGVIVNFTESSINLSNERYEERKINRPFQMPHQEVCFKGPISENPVEILKYYKSQADFACHLSLRFDGTSSFTIF